MPKLANQWAAYLYVIKNAEAFNSGKITDFNEVGVKALDDQTLEISLINSAPYFLQLLYHNSMYPVPVKTIEKFGAIDERSTPWTRPENFVGNGPFVPTVWTPNTVFIVKKNPAYWDADNVKLNQINFLPIENRSVEERMYRNGLLHILSKLPPDKIEKYKGSPELRTFPNYATYFYRFNVNIKPLDDARVRKALAYSINREQITKSVTKGGEIPMYSLTPPDSYYSPNAKLVYDIALAKKLLAEAGYPDGKGFPKLMLTYNTDEAHLKIAVAIQQMWKNNLGIDVDLQNQEWKVFLSNQHQMNYQISRASWVGDYLDPNTFLEMFITDGGNNETGWSNPEYDRLIRAASLAKSKEERVEYFQQAEAMLMDEVPIMPIYIYSWNRLVSPSVNGWVDNLQDFFAFKNVSLTAGDK
jgi:oligopeptide transport system substrate-binding protein